MSTKLFEPISLFDFSKIQELNVDNHKPKDITNFIVVPEAIKNQMNFAIKTHIDLITKYPDDDYLKYLESDQGIETMLSTNWYEKYNIKKT